MELLEAIRSSGMTYRLGWALLHSLWIGAGLGLLFALAARLFRQSASLRYVMACVALAALVGLSAAAFVLTPAPVLPAAQVAAPLPTTANVLSPDIDLPAMPVSAATPSAAQPAAILASETTTPTTPQAKPAIEAAQTNWRAGLTASLEPALPWLTLIWSAGVLLLALWQLVGWLQAGCGARVGRLTTQPSWQRLTPWPRCWVSVGACGCWSPSAYTGRLLLAGWRR